MPAGPRDPLAKLGAGLCRLALGLGASLNLVDEFTDLPGRASPGAFVTALSPERQTCRHRVDLGEDRLGDEEAELVGAPGFVKRCRQAWGAGEGAP